MRSSLVRAVGALLVAVSATSCYIAGPKSFVVVATEATGEATAAEPLAAMREYHQRTVDGVVAI